MSDSLSHRSNHPELRFKALGYVIIEDEFVSSLALGGEWHLGPKYSIVTDIVHLRWRHEREIDIQPSPEEYIEYAQKDRRNFVVIEARRYLFTQRKIWNKYYVAGWHKSGIRRIQSEEKYLETDLDIVQQHSHFHDAGIALGVKLGKPCWYFDISMGYGYRWEYISQQEVYHPLAPREFLYDQTHHRSTFHIRVNFCLPFCK